MAEEKQMKKEDELTLSSQREGLESP